MQHRFVLKFLRWFCPPALYEGIEGDLIEQYEEDTAHKGEKIANRRLWMNVLRFFRPSILFRNRFKLQLIAQDMLSSYLKTTLRNLLNSKGYSFINILGLSLGIAVCILTFSYVQFETSFDQSHPDVDRLYRVNQTNIWDPKGGIIHSTGPAVAFDLKSDFPEIEDILRINTPGAQVIRYIEPDGNVRSFNEGWESVFAADSNFFSFFDFKLSEGDPRTALKGKNKVVISDLAARKLFGNEDPIGKILLYGDDKISVEVTGVTEPQPENMHFHFDYMLSMYTNQNIKEFEWSWIWTQVVTYVKVRQGTDVAALDDKLKTFADRHAPATFERIGMSYKDFIAQKGGWFLYLQPVTSIYLDPDHIGNRLAPTGDITYVYILITVSLFVLLIAVVNFINLSTARGTKRAKEVGVKKSLGLMRRSLIWQFQFEHIFVTAISVLLGVGIMEVLRLFVERFIGIEIPVNWTSPYLLAFVILMPFVIGFLAGLYPSFYLTAFHPAQILKGKLSTGMRSSGLRNVLVVSQFAISIALMTATMVVYSQLDFFRNYDLGLNKDRMLIVNNAEKLAPQLESFRNELSNLQGINQATVSMDIRGGYQDLYTREGDDKQITISTYKVDSYFFETTGISLVAGRAFDDRRPSDDNAVVINKTIAAHFGWTPEEAIGKKIVYVGDDVGAQEVIGVTNDFHFQSLRNSIAPFMFASIRSHLWGDTRIVLIRYQTNDLTELIQKIDRLWSSKVQDLPFSASFYDEYLKLQYKQEERMSSLFSIFTVLSILIAVIGLVGLVAYSAEVRKKEIGIRKVFGASVSRIVVMMNSQYIRLILVGLAIATPISWWVLQEWLNTFEYRIKISPMVFILAGVFELVLALVSVGYLSVRAAMTNPSNVLKEE